MPDESIKLSEQHQYDKKNKDFNENEEIALQGFPGSRVWDFMSQTPCPGVQNRILGAPESCELHPLNAIFAYCILKLNIRLKGTFAPIYQALCLKKGIRDAFAYH